MKAGSTSDSVYKKWSDEAGAKLQDCFAITDWNMFRDSSDDIEEYTTSVTGFINKCIEDVVPTVTVRMYIPQPEAMDYRSFKFLCVHINNKLDWSKHTKTAVKRAQQSLFLLRKQNFGMGPEILKRFYSCNIKRIVSLPGMAMLGL